MSWKDIPPDVVKKAYQIRRGSNGYAQSWPSIARDLGYPWQSLCAAVRHRYYPPGELRR